MIAGGYDKHLPFDELGKAFCQLAKAVILTGDTSEKIAASIEAARESTGTAERLSVHHENTLKGAVQYAFSIAESSISSV
mgnify:FL=1